MRQQASRSVQLLGLERQESLMALDIKDRTSGDAGMAGSGGGFAQADHPHRHQPAGIH